MESDLGVESMTVVELSKWLEQQGIPDQYREKFEGALVYTHPGLVMFYDIYYYHVLGY